MSSSDRSELGEAPDVDVIEEEQGSYVRGLGDDEPLPVDRHADVETRARILRSISRVKLTDDEVRELDARLHGTSRVLRTFRRALADEIARIVAARKDKQGPDSST